MRDLKKALLRETIPSLRESWSDKPFPRDWDDTHISRMVRSTHPEWEKTHPQEWAKAEHPSRKYTVAKWKEEEKKQKKKRQTDGIVTGGKVIVEKRKQRPSIKKKEFHGGKKYYHSGDIQSSEGNPDRKMTNLLATKRNPTAKVKAKLADWDKRHSAYMRGERSAKSAGPGKGYKGTPGLHPNRTVY